MNWKQIPEPPTEKPATEKPAQPEKVPDAHQIFAKQNPEMVAEVVKLNPGKVSWCIVLVFNYPAQWI